MGDKEFLKQMWQSLTEEQNKRDLRMEELALATQGRDERLAKILEAMLPAAGGAAVPVLAAAPTTTVVSGALPSYPQFDPATEIWPEYWARFKTYLVAHSVPEEKKPHVFLTNQSTLIYRMLTNMAAQQATPKEIDELTLDEIIEFMREQYDPKKFVVRERYNFWRKMDRKPGETISELAARLRADAATCDFTSIKDPLDEALRTRFFCSVNNEGALKALFRVKDDELTFAKAVEIAQEIENVSAVAKETVYGRSKSSINQVSEPVDKVVREKPSKRQPLWRKKQNGPTGAAKVCMRCGNSDHQSDACRHKKSVCHHCGKTGHLKNICQSRMKGDPPSGAAAKIRNIKETSTVNVIRHRDGHSQGPRAASGGTRTGAVPPAYAPVRPPPSSQRRAAATTVVESNAAGRLPSPRLVRSAKQVAEETSVPVLLQPLTIAGQDISFEIDTGAGDSFIDHNSWVLIGQPPCVPCKGRYETANKSPLDVVGTVTVEVLSQSGSRHLDFNVTNVPRLNLLGRANLQKLGISMDALLETSPREPINKVFDNLPVDEALVASCERICEEFPDVFKDGLGCLRDYELEVAFKDTCQPTFHRPRQVPLALRDRLTLEYESGVRKGVWERRDNCGYGTPVVPHQKKLEPGQTTQKLRVCGDYSAYINSQLEPHRYPMPSPEDLIQKLGGGYCYSKIDLAEAFHQIRLGPVSQERLAISTHEGVFLQKRLPYGIKSAPAYFQQTMNQLIHDLKGVVVYVDDLIVTGKDADDHKANLRSLLALLEAKGLRCRKSKCEFGLPSVEYLGVKLSSEGIAKGAKVDAVLNMPRPTDVSTLKSFLGSVQFYSKFLKPNYATVRDPLNQLTRKENAWQWGEKEEAAFLCLKDMLCEDTVLAHFDSSLPLGISTDASNVGLGAVLFHRYPDGTERPILNESKILNDTQRRYSQIDKEALGIIFAIDKFYKYIYGRQFILVTDHKPLLALFSPTKETPALAANRLARWALKLSQFDYTIEYRRTDDHGNADALSRLPWKGDEEFDREESEDDTRAVCIIRETIATIEGRSKLPNQEISKLTQKDPVLSAVSRYVRDGWPDKVDSNLEHYKKVATSLICEGGCVFYGNRLVIPTELQPRVLKTLHLGHFGMERMKKLARTAVYWHGITAQIEDACRKCVSCAEHQNAPPKAPDHPWMLPEKPWSRLHIDHAISFKGFNWLVVVDAYSKFPCIHPTMSITAKATTNLLEEDFALFGYPHAIVSDNGPSFACREFREWCSERGIEHITGAPYHPATNGTAERTIKTFKKSLESSSKPPREALQEYLMYYRRMPFDDGPSPSELLNGRLMRTMIDTLLPTPVQRAQARQMLVANKTNQDRQRQDQQSPRHSVPLRRAARAQAPFLRRKSYAGGGEFGDDTADDQPQGPLNNVRRLHVYVVGEPCYALYYGPRRKDRPRWVPAVVTKVYGARSVNVRVAHRGPVWRRHIDQLRPRYGDAVDAESDSRSDGATTVQTQGGEAIMQPEADALDLSGQTPPPATEATTEQYGRHNLRRGSRQRKPTKIFSP